MSLVSSYRDDGVLATALARALPVPRRAPALLLALAAMLPIALVLLLADDVGPAALVAAAWFVLLMAASATAPAGRLGWLVPPLLRAFEYAVLIRVTAMADGAAMPACYALLGVVALHHYDMVYRLRHRSAPTPAWVDAVGGGWEGRVLAVTVLALIGGNAVRVGLIVAAVALAVVYVAESVSGWRRYSPGVGAVQLDDEGLEQA